MLTRRATLGGLVLSGLAPAGRALAMGQAVPDLAALSGTLVQGGWARGRMITRPRLLLDGKPVSVDPSGNFFIAFDRDAAPEAVLSGIHGLNPARGR
jgi:hypothetical protein